MVSPAPKLIIGLYEAIRSRVIHTPKSAGPKARARTKDCKKPAAFANTTAVKKKAMFLTRDILVLFLCGHCDEAFYQLRFTLLYCGFHDCQKLSEYPSGPVAAGPVARSAG